MLSLEVVGPGDGLSKAPSRAVTATAAYSCDRTAAARLLRLGGSWRWRRRGVPALMRWAQDLYLFQPTIRHISISLYSALLIALAIISLLVIRP